jgi:REP element-mobilizing transposase RayT
MTFNPDIHHRRSIRLREYDYSSAGAYFVTICTQGKECLFGRIDGDVMVLNDVGRMVKIVWQSLPERFPGIALDEFVVMLNHVHGIIMLHDGRGESCIRPDVDGHRLTFHNQGDHKDRPYGKTDVPHGTLDGSLGRIVQAFKSITTHEYTVGVKQSGWRPFSGRLWQRNYYERVVRDDGELHGFREYIRYNPLKWADDDNHIP